MPSSNEFVVISGGVSSLIISVNSFVSDPELLLNFSSNLNIPDSVGVQKNEIVGTATPIFDIYI